MIQMLCEVEMRLDRTCDAEAFLLNPTVKGVARVLRGDGGAIGSGAALLNLARGNPRLRPLFLIPAHSGFRTEYATLAQALHSDIPTYAIQLRPAQTAVDGDAFAEDIRFYVRTIREAEPDGPYALAGYSAGGIVAIAIADALHESGQRVDFVGLIDTAPPSSVEILSPFTSLSRFVRFSRVLASRLGELRDAAARRRILSSLRSAIINTMKHPFSEIPTNVTSDEILESSAGLLTPEEQQIMQRRLNAILSYKLHGNPLEAVLFRTPLDPYFRGPHEPDLAWGRALKRRVVVENVPGPHIRMLKPAGAQRLAKLFERHLLSRSRLSVKILPELLGLSAALVNCV
jgi:thioesterase domain-containing protein